MQIPKDKIIEFIRDHAGQEKASQAQGELPDQVDTDRDRGLLEKYGVDVGDLIGRFAGNIPGL